MPGLLQGIKVLEVANWVAAPAARNPRLIYVVLTGYGVEGPERDRAGFDYAAFWARSGIMGTLGEQGESPVQQRPGTGDQTTSLAIMAAVALALYERERS